MATLLNCSTGTMKSQAARAYRNSGPCWAGSAVVPWYALGGGLGTAATSTSMSPTGTPTSSLLTPSREPPTPPPLTPQGPPLTTPPDALAGVSELLRVAAGQLLPDATFGPVPVGFPDGSKSLSAFGVVDNGFGYYIGGAQIERPSTRGQFVLIVFPDASNPKAAEPGCNPGGPSRLGCVERTGPNGERLTLPMGTWDGSDIVEYKVKVHRQDEVILVGSVTNSVNTTGYMTIPPNNPSPPMTTEQILTLLPTPGLTIP